MKRTVRLLTSSAMHGRSEHEAHIHGVDDDPTQINAYSSSHKCRRYIYKDGRFGRYLADSASLQPDSGCVSYHALLPAIVNGADFARQQPSTFEKPTPERIKERLEQLSKHGGPIIGLISYTDFESHIQNFHLIGAVENRPMVEFYSFSPVIKPGQVEEPDLTMADKEWIDKIDGHSLRIEDLY